MLEQALHASEWVARRGGDFDRWDLEVRGGAFGAARLRMAVEEHGQGRQLRRFRLWPRASRSASALVLFLAALAGAAALDHARATSVIISAVGLLLAARMAGDCAAAMAAFLAARWALADAPGPGNSSPATPAGSTPSRG